MLAPIFIPAVPLLHCVLLYQLFLLIALCHLPPSWKGGVPLPSLRPSSHCPSSLQAVAVSCSRRYAPRRAIGVGLWPAGAVGGFPVERRPVCGAMSGSPSHTPAGELF